MGRLNFFAAGAAFGGAIGFAAIGSAWWAVASMAVFALNLYIAFDFPGVSPRVRAWLDSPVGGRKSFWLCFAYGDWTRDARLCVVQQPSYAAAQAYVKQENINVATIVNAVMTPHVVRLQQPEPPQPTMVELPFREVRP